MTLDNNVNISAIILAGGMGTRIRTIEPIKPKVMIDIYGKPFISFIIDRLKQNGINNVIILCGYKHEYIIDYFSATSDSDLNIIFSVEGELMGTAGSLLNVKNFLRDSSILLMNGDTYVNVNYKMFYKQHKDLSAEYSICIKDISNITNINTDYAGIDIDSNNRIISYNEKSNGKFASCGVYLFDHEVFKYLTNTPYSIEFDLIPRLLKNDVHIYGYETEELYYDIGTPEGLKNFKNYIK